jgi:hypothetical protein
MLFTKVAATLAESHDWTLLAIPAVAVIQVYNFQGGHLLLTRLNTDRLHSGQRQHIMQC